MLRSSPVLAAAAICPSRSARRPVYWACSLGVVAWEASRSRLSRSASNFCNVSLGPPAAGSLRAVIEAWKKNPLGDASACPSVTGWGRSITRQASPTWTNVPICTWPCLPPLSTIAITFS